MSDKIKNTEKNIRILLNSSFSKEYKPDQQLKDNTLYLLLLKAGQRKKTTMPESILLIGLVAVWIAITSFLFVSEIRISLSITYLIKSALCLSLILVPVSSLLLIIQKFRIYGR